MSHIHGLTRNREEKVVYSDDIIEEVRGRSDIVDVISGYVRLTRKGSSYFGLCPFHNENHLHFPCRGRNRCFIVSAVEREEMFFLLS